MIQTGKLSFVALACALIASIGSGQQVGDVSNRISGGAEAKPGEFPFMATTEILVNGSWMTWCGGSIIGQRHILTLVVSGNYVKPDEIRVKLGCHDLSECNNVYGVSEIIVQPGYKGEMYDIAIIKLDRPIEFSQTVGLGSIGKITLNEKMLDDEKWGNLTVIGWGQIFTPIESGVLKKADVRVNPAEVCEKNLPISLPAEFMCAIGDNEGVCRGDMGGPLFKTLDDGTRLQVGVTIFGGTKLCELGGIYVRVAPSYSWIMERIGE